jgi:hypothetical protein
MVDMPNFLIYKQEVINNKMIIFLKSFFDKAYQ